MNFAGMSFRYTNFKSANFAGADLTGADFTGADLRGANFINADLMGADFTGADLRSANFTDADLTSADFTDADLRDAVLYRTDLRHTNFASAKLDGTCLDPRNKPNSDVTRFKVIKNYVIGYRSLNSLTIDPECIYKPGWCYAPVFSTSNTLCHPGIYLRPDKQYNDICVKAYIKDIHRVNNKWRARKIFVYRDKAYNSMVAFYKNCVSAKKAW